MNTIKGLLLIGVAATALTGCTTMGTNGARMSQGLSAPGATQAPAPVVVENDMAVRTALACLGTNWPNRTEIFGVGSTNDNSGKLNMSSDGGTGRYLSEDASSILMSALKSDAGLRVIDLTPEHFAMLENVVRFGGTAASSHTTEARRLDSPNYTVRATFNTLDFTGAQSVDVRIGGIGPMASTQGAVVSTSVLITNVFTGELVGESTLTQYVSYNAIGLGVATADKGTLFSAGAQVSNQQMIQLAAAYATTYGLVDAMLDISGSPQVCRNTTGAATGQNA